MSGEWTGEAEVQNRLLTVERSVLDGEGSRASARRGGLAVDGLEAVDLRSEPAAGAVELQGRDIDGRARSQDADVLGADHVGGRVALGRARRGEVPLRLMGCQRRASYITFKRRLTESAASGVGCTK
jgi:hypothetical protein